MSKLKDYDILCQVKPKSLITKYPYTPLSNEQILKTLNRIELVYQHLSPVLVKKSKNKSGGGKAVTNKIIVFTGY